LELLFAKVNTFIGAVHSEFCMAAFQRIYAQLGGAWQHAIARDLVCPESRFRCLTGDYNGR
jgi:hypothetical protein